MLFSSENMIGPAGAVLEVMKSKVARLRNTRASALKVLFYGPPGVGKTAVAYAAARQLAGHELAIEHANGKEVSVNVVRDWISELSCAGSLFGDWCVKVVDELDCCSRDAQDLLLTYLDRLPPGRAFIGTSNLQLDMLQERFQTRLQQFRVDAPNQEDIAGLVSGRFSLSADDAEQIAFGAGGNVRAALLDAESLADTHAASRLTTSKRKK